MKTPWIVALSLAIAFASHPASARTKKRVSTKSVKTLLNHSSSGGRPNQTERGRRAENFERLELWQLAFIERLGLVRENPNATELAKLGELALILGRFEDVGRLQTELLQHGRGVNTWPAAFRSAVAGFFLEIGNLTAAAQAVPGPGQLQQMPPRARLSAALISGAVALGRGNANLAMDSLLRSQSDSSADFSYIYLQRARILYDAGRLTEAMEELTNVPRSSPAWYPGLFVSAWSSYRAGDTNLALGLLMSMHSPYLTDKFNPESYVLEAATFYRLCQYTSALRSVNELKSRYKTMMTSLGRVERQLDGSLESVSTLLAYAAGDNEPRWNLSESDWKLVAGGLLSEPALAQVSLSLVEVEKARAFLKSSGNSSDSSFLKSTYNSFSNEMERARVEALRRGRRRMLAKIRNMRDETAATLENALAVEVEINSRIRDRLISGKLPRYKDIDFDAEINKGYEFWPYQGEFWRDEAGSYVFATSDVCANERASQ